MGLGFPFGGNGIGIGVEGRGQSNKGILILRLNYIGSMNKKNETWTLEMEEVNRIKAGVLKYIE